jgi:catechol 2,3-dioxygenase-like lactoylglutathione lyase family enzyme
MSSREEGMPPIGTTTRDVIIRVPDFDASVRFYTDVLGLPVFHRDERLVGFETGGFRLYVEPGEATGPVFEFVVANVSQCARALEAAGCRIIEEDPSVPRCYVQDPNGFVFNLHSKS